MNAANSIRNRFKRLWVYTILLSAPLSILSGAISFSVDGASATVAPDDIFNPGPVVLLPGASAIPLPPVEVNAFSYGHVTWDDSTVFFRVDRPSLGAVGAVLVESSVPGDQAADVYSSTLLGTNVQVWDGDGSSAPGLGLLESSTDDLDGLDMRPGPTILGGIFWSVDPASATGYGGGATAADIWFSPPVPGYSTAPALFAAAPALGLAPGDDIDALVVLDLDANTGWSAGDGILFSLSPGSPSLATIGTGATPADILIVAFGGFPESLSRPLAWAFCRPTI
jgi:hypothetical protein